MIKLSIIIPFYNVEQYIAQCLDSVYQQDIPESEYEVICVNDASPDGSREIVKEYQKKHKNLVLVEHGRNKKLGGARNTGIKAAQGTYVLFVDSDDMLTANCLGRLLEEMTDGCEYIHFNNKTITEDVIKENTQYGKSEVMSGSDLFLNKIVPWTAQIVAWNKIYRLDFLKNNQLYFVEDLMYEDNDFAFRVAAAAKKCRHIDYSPYVYRMNPYSVTGQSINAQRLIYWQKIWPRMLTLIPYLSSIDKRFNAVVNSYLVEDLYDMLRQMEYLSPEDNKKIKKSISWREWYNVIRILPLRRRIIYIYNLARV